MFPTHLAKEKKMFPFHPTTVEVDIHFLVQSHTRLENNKSVVYIPSNMIGHQTWYEKYSFSIHVRISSTISITVNMEQSSNTRAEETMVSRILQVIIGVEKLTHATSKQKATAAN